MRRGRSMPGAGSGCILSELDAIHSGGLAEQRLLALEQIRAWSEGDFLTTIASFSPRALGRHFEQTAAKTTPGNSKVTREGFGEYAAAENFWRECGASFRTARRPRYFGDRKATLGGIYDDNDQPFAGLRWMP
jgi:hypothetical protein